MINKVAFAVSAALMSMSVNAATELGTARASDFTNLANVKFQQVKALSVKKEQAAKYKNNIFVEEPNLAEGSYRYIVRLTDDPVALYRGGVDGLRATNPSVANRGLRGESSRKLDVQQSHVKAYRSYVEGKQTTFISKAQNKLGRALDVTQRTQLAVNAIVAEMSQAEAKKLASLPGVARVEREVLRHPNTDSGPHWIKADKVWDGTASGVAHKGEGMVVGIIDTGINADNPSFADVAGDGYDHTNPYGEGVYFGDCLKDEYVSLCNDKLVGVVSYPTLTDMYADYDDTMPKNGVDYNGHGSHTAGTTAGNYLENVAIVDAEGNDTAVTFESIAGVAPRANIISYQVCLPGEDDAIDFRGCFPSLTIQAIEHAIENKVDALNYSVGGGSSNPWNDADSLAFLSARAAGIHVATSAGNSGPEPATVGSPGDAPWLTTVAAYTHDRGFSDKTIGSFTGGSSDAPANLTGKAMSGSITGKIVYAGNFENANDPDGDSAQCLQPFPAGTFTSDMIVVCDRGAIARVQKGINVRDGGAGGLVLANLDGGATSVVADPHVIPAIHLDAANGDLLKAWLADGASDHGATITDTEITHDAAFANIAAGFTSRGPGASIPDIMVPDVAAPGVQIFASYADEQSAGFKEFPDPANYSFLSGTSMASPHVAGALTLIAATRPDWTPAEVQSALMLTADDNTFKEDGETPSDFFDAGAGMIQIDNAVQSGLVLNETRAGYEEANPESGDPKNVNLASMANSQCVGICSWTRTLTAKRAGAYTATGVAKTDGLNISISPASFELAEGEEVEITVTADAVDATSEVWAFGHVVLEAEGIPTAKMPVAVNPSNGNIPEQLRIEAHRDADSLLLTDLQSVKVTDFTSTVSGLTVADIAEGELPVDSANGSAYDDLTDGIATYWVTVPEDAKRFVAEIVATSSSDIDLRVGLDTNGDGVVTEDEEVARSATATAFEKVSLMNPAAGSYWITVQNWEASAEGATDKFELATASVTAGTDNENLDVVGPTGTIEQLTDYDIRFNWDVDFSESSVAYGVVELGPDAENPTTLGTVAVDIVRGKDDVRVEANTDGRVEAGDTVDFTVTIDPNFTNEDREYAVEVELPETLTLVADSVTGEGVVDGNKISWSQVQPSLRGLKPNYAITTSVEDATCTAPAFGQEGNYIDLAGFGIGFSSIDGDGVSGAFDSPANFFGELRNGFTVTDDGFIFFSGDAGTRPYVNQKLPNPDAPNDLVAPLWRDMVVSNADDSGISVATAGDAWTIVEFDNMRHYNFYNDQPEVTDILDFQVVFSNETGNFMYIYDNVEHNFGDVIPTTVGFESSDSSSAGMFAYTSSAEKIGTVAAITNDLIICHTLQEPDVEPVTYTFSATVADDYEGGSIGAMISSKLGDQEAETSTGNVEVEGAPVISVAQEASYQEGHAVVVDASASTDPNGDDLTFTWAQVNGTGVEFTASGAELSFDAPAVDGDATVTFALTVTDGKFTETTNVDVVIAEGNPVISISAPPAAEEDSSVALNASGTTDPNGDELTYTWAQLSGPVVQLSATNGAQVNFTAPDVTSDQVMTFSLVVSDGVNSSSETVTVKVSNKSGGGSFGWLIAALIPFLMVRRRKH